MQVVLSFEMSEIVMIESFGRFLDCSDEHLNDEFPGDLARLAHELEQSDAVEKSELENGDLIALRRAGSPNDYFHVGKYQNGEIKSEFTLIHQVSISDSASHYELRAGSSSGASIYEELAITPPSISEHIHGWDRGYSIEDFFSEYELEIVRLNNYRDIEPLKYVPDVTKSKFLEQVSDHARSLKEEANL